jgi:hypothetical protein
MLKAYMIHAGEPQNGAALVFAASFREAKKLGFNSGVCDGCDYTDVRGHQIKSDQWLKNNAADKEKLGSGVPHIVDSPPSCEQCELWYDELFDGVCESCADYEAGKAGGGE